MEKRRKDFKSNNTNAREKSRSQTLSLRKEKRGSALAVKRQIELSSDGSSSTEVINEESLQRAAQSLKTENDQTLLEGLNFVRKVVTSPFPHIGEFFNLGLLEILCTLLSKNNTEVKFQSACCLTGLAYGDKSEDGRILSILPTIISILQLNTESNVLKIQLCWVIGNLAGDYDSYRKTILETGIFGFLVDFFFQFSVKEEGVNDTKGGHIISWVLSNLTRGSIPADYFLSTDCLTKLVNFLLSSSDIVIWTEMSWFFTFLSAKENETAISIALDLGLYQALLQILRSYTKSQDALKSETAVIPALRCIRNIVLGSLNRGNEIIKYQGSNGYSSNDLVYALLTFTDPSMVFNGNEDQLTLFKESLYVIQSFLSFDTHGNDSLTQERLNLISWVLSCQRVVAPGVDQQIISQLLKESSRVLDGELIEHLVTTTLLFITQLSHQSFFHFELQELLCSTLCQVALIDNLMSCNAVLKLLEEPLKLASQFYIDNQVESFLTFLLELIREPACDSLMLLDIVNLLTMFCKITEDYPNGGIMTALIDLEFAEPLENIQYRVPESELAKKISMLVDNIYENMENMNEETDNQQTESFENSFLLATQQENQIIDFGVFQPMTNTVLDGYSNNVEVNNGNDIEVNNGVGCGRGNQLTKPAWMNS